MPVLVLRTVEQFWLYLRALEVDKDRLGAVLDDIRRRAPRAGHSGTKDHGAQSSNAVPELVVAGALRRHVLLPRANYPGFATLWMWVTSR